MLLNAYDYAEVTVYYPAGDHKINRQLTDEFQMKIRLSPQ
jgi:hypothetical protein